MRLSLNKPIVVKSFKHMKWCICWQYLTLKRNYNQMVSLIPICGVLSSIRLQQSKVRQTWASGLSPGKYYSNQTLLAE